MIFCFIHFFSCFPCFFFSLYYHCHRSFYHSVNFFCSFSFLFCRQSLLSHKPLPSLLQIPRNTFFIFIYEYMFVLLHKNTLFQKVLPYLSMQQYATITFLFYSPTHNDSDIFFVCSRLYQLVRKVLTILLPHIIPATASHVFPFFHHILQFFQAFFLCIKWYIHITVYPF